MPKQPAGKTKFQRMQALSEVLERWGKLDKAKIDVLVASHLDVTDVETLKKPLYRDLKEMVESGKAIAYYFAADGSPIENFNPEIQKNVKAEWALVGGKDQQIQGQGALAAAGGSFYAFERIMRNLSIESGSPAFETQNIHLFFGIQSIFFCLKINVAALPVSIIVSRTPGPSDSPPPIEALEKKFGKRAGLLQVPVPSVSGIKPGERDGHLVLKFTEEGSVEITDLKSTNGTKFHQVSPKDAEVMRESGDLLGKETVNADWIRAAEKLKEWKGCAPLGHVNSPLPALIKLSQDFQVLIV